jgi:putative lipoic acid-binding regulatory protein
MSEQDTLFEFPCDFPIKAFGHDTGDFRQLVMERVQRHAPEVTADAVHTRSSRGGRYLAVTVTVRAHSRAQLDNIYATLSAEERVLFAL